MDGPSSDAPPVPPSTLVQYTEPLRVETMEERYGSKLQAPRLDQKPRLTQGAGVLNMILPPRDLGRGWVQMASPEVPTRGSVRELTAHFEFRLKDAKARATGLCAVRGIIYSMLFDEMLRQVAVDCPERGLLMMRLRNELRMTTDAYQALYEASVGLGRRKSIEAERGKQEMADKIQALRGTKSTLQAEVRRLEAKLTAMERCCLEQQQADRKKYTEEMSFLQYTAKRLEEQEEAIKRMQEEEKKALVGG